MFRLTPKRNKDRRDEAVYESLYSTPVDFGTQLIPPANGNFAFSLSASVTDSQFRINIFGPVTRELDAPALASNEIFKIGFVEKDFRLYFSCAVVRTMTLYLVRNNGTFFTIGTGVID